MLHRKEQIPYGPGDIVVLRGRHEYDGLPIGTKCRCLSIEEGMFSGVNNMYATVEVLETEKAPAPKYIGYWWRWRNIDWSEEKTNIYHRTGKLIDEENS